MVIQGVKVIIKIKYIKSKKLNVIVTNFCFVVI